MINKPINPSPHNCCVDINEDVYIKYEIPNAKIDGCVTCMNDLDTGSCVLVQQKDYSEPTNQISLNIGKSLIQQAIIKSQDIVLLEDGNFEVLFDEEICINAGDVLNVEINNNGTITTQSLLVYGNPTTFNNISEGDWLIKNDIMPNGIIITPNIEYTSGATISVIVNRTNKGEYSWNSFYWKTPSPLSVADKYCTVTGKNSTNGAIRIQADGKLKGTAIPTYKKSFVSDTVYVYDSDQICTRCQNYIKSHFLECGHTIGDDTSSYCATGILEDYFGYASFLADGAVFNNIINIGLGKCVINIYKDDRFVSSAKCLAYDDFGINTEGSRYIVIIDNENFHKELGDGCGDTLTVTYEDGYRVSHDDYCYPYSKAEFYDINDLNKQEHIQGMIFGETKNCIINNSKYLEYEYELYTYPCIAENIEIGDVISVWSHEKAEFNTTPTYYFRAKTPPDISINDYSQFEIDDDINYLRDINCKFGLNYNSLDIKLNYYYLYLYVLNPKSHKWGIKERSPMLYNLEDTYEFKGLANGQEYKVYAVCTDNDGDEWTTDEIEFVVDPLLVTIDIPTAFNKKNATIELYVKEILNGYTKYAHLEFYRVLKKDIDAVKSLEYAGEVIGKISELTICNKWNDYNIKNNSYYNYYIRVKYTGKQSDEDKGVDIYHVNSDIYTNFEGTSILSLEKTSSDKLGIKYSFNLLYHFDSNMNELTYEISRDYINSFSKYPKELKGHQNYITSSCSGLLGSENNGIYEEPKDMRAAWSNFVNDDSIKLYRGLDGETMIISIETSKIKPYNYPSVGLVNEVHFTFKEIASADTYAIFTTEIVGD